MKKRSTAIGPGAASLILIILVVSMSVLGMLSVMSARNDISLSERSLTVTANIYELNRKSEESFAAADRVLKAAAEKAANEEEYLAAVKENLPAEMELDGTEIIWTEYAGLSAANVSGLAVNALTGQTVSDRQAMLCVLRLLPLEELRSGGEVRRAEWETHILINQ